MTQHHISVILGVREEASTTPFAGRVKKKYPLRVEGSRDYIPAFLIRHGTDGLVYEDRI